ncbi:MAG: glycosyltransferase family 2 protein [Cypionkella sp.]
MSEKLISVVIPVLNEESTVGPLIGALRPVLDGLGLAWNILFVDDGSTDRTMERVRALAMGEPRIKAISFSRNFGKEQAMAAGLRYAKGDCVLIMDADLQHPPEYIPEFVRYWRQGSKVVFGQRNNRVTDGFLRRVYSNVFHVVFGVLAGARLPRGIVDFVLLDRSAVAAMNALDERSRFTKGMFTWIGFNTAVVPFDVGERVAGQTQFNFFKLLRFALDGIVSFSTLPLRMWSYVGVFISLSALLYSVYFVIKTLLFDADVPGFPSLLVAIFFFAGVQMISLGVIGEYVGRIFDEVKRRPLYIVAEEVGFAEVPEPGLPEPGLPEPGHARADHA